MNDSMISNSRLKITTNKKLMLISFNTKEGMKLVMDSYISNFINNLEVIAIADVDYKPNLINHDHEVNNLTLLKLSHSRNHVSMAMDVANISLIIKIVTVYIKTKPDICYLISAHPLNPLILIVFRLFARFSNPSVKLVSHIHDIKPHAETKGYAFIDFFQSLQVQQSDMIAVYGNTLKQMLMSHFKVKPERILVTVLGVTRVSESKYLQQSAQVPKYITLTGRLDKYKGIDLFLDAARYFQDHNFDLKFILAGRGDLSEYQDKINHLTNITVINKFLSDDEVDNLIIQSQVVVLPYIDASQSGVIPIAYFNGCPVIVSNVGGLPEAIVVGKTGYVFESGNCAQLIKHIKNIVENKELRHQLGINSFNYYRNQLKWNVIIGKLLQEIMV
jgi:glycosyltransferase involved in cell wall biosynthesis